MKTKTFLAILALAATLLTFGIYRTISVNSSDKPENVEKKSNITMPTGGHDESSENHAEGNNESSDNHLNGDNE